MTECNRNQMAATAATAACQGGGGTRFIDGAKGLRLAVEATGEAGCLAFGIAGLAQLLQDFLREKRKVTRSDEPGGFRSVPESRLQSGKRSGVRAQIPNRA